MKLDLLVCSYGIDSALSQILYYHHTGIRNFITLSRSDFFEYINNINPSIVINFDSDFIKSNFDLDCVIFNKTHSITATNQLAQYLNVDRSIIKYAHLSDKLNNYDEDVESVLNYYEAVGHDNFVNRFIIDKSLILSKAEIAMSTAFVAEHQYIAKEYLYNFGFFKDGIAIVRSNFKLGRYLEEAIIDRYAEDGLKLIVTYNYNGTECEVRIKAKKDIKNKLLENIPKKYINRGVMGTEVNIYDIKDLNDCEDIIHEVLFEAWNKMEELDKKKVFDEYDKKINLN